MCVHGTLFQLADWTVKLQDPRKMFDNHTSFLAAEIILPFLCFLTFIHGKC